MELVRNTDSKAPTPDATSSNLGEQEAAPARETTARLRIGGNRITVCNFRTQERLSPFRDKPTLGFLPENVCSTFLS